MRKFISLILVLLVFVPAVLAAPFQADAKTKRIPAGTKFTLKLLSPVTSYGTNHVDFTAILLSDQTADTDVILPSGSVVRGAVNKIVPAKRFSKGAIVYMDFDHVVTPNGRQVPLSLSIVGRSDMTYDGGITTTKGYLDALKINGQRTVEITKSGLAWGQETLEDTPVAHEIMIGLGAVGGAIGGAAYYVYDGIADMIRKGADVNLQEGEILNVILVEPIDVPVI